MRTSEVHLSPYSNEYERGKQGSEAETSPLGRRLLLRTHHHNRAVGVADHRVGDAAYQSPSHSSEASTAENHQPGTDLLRQPHDRRIRTPQDEV
jgi:hypothetical protein